MSKHWNPPASKGSENPRRENHWSIQHLAISALSILETILLVVALDYLGFADGENGLIKLTVFGLAAALVSYIVNRLSIERGVLLVKEGSKLAGLVGGFSIVLVGTAFFIATSSGLLTPQVEESRLGDHIQKLGVYADGRISVANKAAELAPVMQSMAEDLHKRSTLEGGTGEGPIFRALRSLFGRAEGLSEQMTVSLGVRQDVLSRITALRGKMESTVAEEQVDIWERRAALRAQHGQMLSLLSELDKAVPVSLVRSYASELQSGVLIPNRDDASAKINRTLAGYANSLMAALAEQNGVAGDPPAFPGKTGAQDVFQYAGKFAHVFLLTATVDLVVPLLIWAYAMMTVISWTPRTPKTPRPKAVYDHVLDLPVAKTNELLRDVEIERNEKALSSRTAPRRANGKSRG